MIHFPYRVLVEFSADDSAYIARVPAFEALAAHGDSPEAAAHEARVAAEAMLATLREQKRPLPAPDASADYSGQLRLRLPRGLHARLSKLASAEDVSLNNLLLSLIAEGLGRHSPPKREGGRNAAK
jgi:predicted RNase H-like HicB family nuclease